MNNLTISEIKAVNEDAKRKERKLYEDKAAYEQAKKSLLAIKDKVDTLELSESDEHFRKEFKDYIDVIAEQDGERPSPNPLKTLADKYMEEATDSYELAKKIINGEKSEENPNESF